MRRRSFVLGTGASLAWSRSLSAQLAPRKDGKPVRVGVLMGIADDTEGQSRIAALESGLRELGWTIGTNMHLDIQWGSGETDFLRLATREMLSRRPDLVLAANTISVSMLLEERSELPIVFVSVFDPIDAGFVTNIARPGGRITGFTNHESSMGGKWLQILTEIAPRVRTAHLIYSSRTAPYTRSFVANALEPTARVLGLGLETHDLANAEDLSHRIAAIGTSRGHRLIAMADPFTAVHRKLIVESAAKHRIPAAYPWRYFTSIGGLFSYGPDIVDNFRRTAAYIDRIARGEYPGDLPVRTPTKFQFVINQRTAADLGLEIPMTLLATADEVIE